MFKSFRIGSLMGIPIKLDVTFLLILPIFAYVIALQVEQLVDLLNVTFGIAIEGEQMMSGWMPWVLGSIAAIGLFASVLLHELGHSSAAIRYGFPIQSITLWLLGGVAQLSEQPTDWREELVIAIAGPLVSIGLGVGLWIAVYAIPGEMGGLLFVISYLALMNLLLAAFNMLPGFPMDGGRVLRALLARNQPFAVATAQAVRVGKIFALGLGLLGLLQTNFFLIAIALFIYIAASGEGRYTALRQAVEGIYVEDVMTPVAQLDVVKPDLTIETLLAQMYRDRHTGYPVIDGDDVVGIVTLDDIRTVPSDQRGITRVEDVMTRELTTVRPQDEALAVIEAFQKNNIGRVLVIDESEELAGLVTRTDLMKALDIGSVSGPQRRAEGIADGTVPIDQVSAAESRPRW